MADNYMQDFIEIICDEKTILSEDLEIVEEHIQSIVENYASDRKKSISTLIIKRNVYEKHSYIERTLLKIYIVSNVIDLKMLADDASTRGVMENVIYVLDESLSLGHKNAILNIASNTSSFIYFVESLDDGGFSSELSENLFNQLKVHEGEIYNIGSEKEVDGQTLSEAADQLDFAIEAISELRLNTTFEIISSLKGASATIRSKSALKDRNSLQDIKDIIKEIVVLSGRLLDAMENKKFAGLAVCGIVGSVVGIIGMPAITATALCMAYAQGPAAFEKFLSSFVDRIGLDSGGKTRNAPPRGRRKGAVPPIGVPKGRGRRKT